jgi:hypothetical protein
LDRKKTAKVSQPFLWGRRSIKDSRQGEFSCQFLYGEPLKVVQRECQWVEVLPVLLEPSVTFWVPSSGIKELPLYHSNGVVSALWAELCETPSFNASVIARYPAGSYLCLKKEKEEWFEVEGVGWIYGSDFYPLAWEQEYEEEVLRWYLVDFSMKF